MKSASILSLRYSITTALTQTRSPTLELLTQIDESLFCLQIHPEFSPIGWHFGHIAFTEAYWLEQLAGISLNFPDADQRLFAADGLPKQERQNLPAVATIKEYLKTIRSQTLDYLATAPIAQQERLWRWLIQHETQHCETISFLRQLYQQRYLDIASFNTYQSISSENMVAIAINATEMLKVEGGKFTIGSDAVYALDNERPAHQIYLNTYWIDRHPVTCRQYAQFTAAGGYQRREYWSAAGWQWLQQYPVNQPLYWSNDADWLDHPVYGVSYYEAEAYSNFVQKRLPTEAEWEKAALGASLNCNHGHLIGHTTPVDTYAETSHSGCQDMLGNVWEWTASWFDGYPRFSPYPYPGYSQVYFDGQHRVLRGGSWATSSVGIRASFRNWYHPQVRQIFAGFRCAKD
ncbi:MAG: ergothioneine biosynthesis protein EgtB [Pleurocapsa sp. SU_5_0]|nr:ergothioneine biosynthesis protein EgtB [Pleurocapsa sp. SU_5_0]